MELPPLRQGTRATVGTFYRIGVDGRLCVVVVIKQRFGIDWSGNAVAVPGAELRLVDEPWDPDAPETSSAKFASDLCLQKVGTDVLAHGNAIAPRSSMVTELDVMVRLGKVQCSVKVFGPRTWLRTMTGASPSAPAPFDSLPLKWELSFGGLDNSNPDKPLEEARNPVGCGLSRDVDTLIGAAVPQIEDPTDLIKTHRSRPKPAGLFPIGPHWEPRRSFAGTLDERWQRERNPIPPYDFDDRHNQVAPADLVSAGFLRGGERVEVLGMNPRGALQFRLPHRAFFTGAVTATGLTEHKNQLDTVLLLPNEEAVELTWRSAIAVPSRVSGISAIQVHEKEIR